MCPHNSFDILYYEKSFMIRKCRNCGQLEIKAEYWVEKNEFICHLQEAEKRGINFDV